MKMTDRMTGWMGGFECTDVNEEVPANLLDFPYLPEIDEEITTASQMENFYPICLSVIIVVRW